MNTVNPERLAKLEAKSPLSSQLEATQPIEPDITPEQQFTPLEQVTNPTVTTNAAAYYLDRRPQTLRIWAVYETAGPIRPIRINGRLAWPTAQLRRVLGVA